MPYTPQTIFESIRPGIPAGLSVRIFSSIVQAGLRRDRAHARIATWSVGLSGVVFLASLGIAGRSFFASDFWQLASLLFSDPALVLSYSEAFLLSLAETFPATAVSVLLVPLLLAVVSLVFRSKYLNLEMQHKQFHFKSAH
jgi:hypothetical protein